MRRSLRASGNCFNGRISFLLFLSSSLYAFPIYKSLNEGVVSHDEGGDSLYGCSSLSYDTFIRTSDNLQPLSFSSDLKKLVRQCFPEGILV